jgi:Type III restriction enzyme, res subunit/Helicase conserved C-terminal domain
MLSLPKRPIIKLKKYNRKTPINVVNKNIIIQNTNKVNDALLDENLIQEQHLKKDPIPNITSYINNIPDTIDVEEEDTVNLYPDTDLVETHVSTEQSEKLLLSDPSVGEIKDINEDQDLNLTIQEKPVANILYNDIPISNEFNGKLEFDKFGIPKPTKNNLLLMSLEDLEKVCKSSWNLSTHINPLLIELSDELTVHKKASKLDKCMALFNYRKNTTKKKITHLDKNDYENFAWSNDTELSFREKIWILQNSTSFKQFINNHFIKYRLNDTGKNLLVHDDPSSPYLYQQSVVDYLSPNTPYRSLLAYHGLGSGKTRTSILLSSQFIKDDKKILVLLPGALRNTFIEQLYNWGIEGIKIPNLDKLSPDERKIQENASNKIISHYYDILTYNEAGLYEKLRMLLSPKGLLENKLIIIDEIHDFVSRMSKPTNLSRKVYHFLMDKTKNCKFLGLSGTPLLNSAHELGILFNILRGKMKNDLTLYPETEEAFNDLFVNYYDRSITNSYLFKRRLSGLISYYAGSPDFSIMPEKIHMPTVELTMSDHQYQLYLQERYLESKGERKKTKNDEISSSGSAFRTYSRLVSNFSFPPDIERPKPISSRDFKLHKKYNNYHPKFISPEDVIDEIDNIDVTIEKTDEEGESSLSKKQRQLTYLNMLDEAYGLLISKDYFTDANLKIYSPKFLHMLQNIKSGEGHQGLIYIYTEFRMLEGVRIFGAILEHHGYTAIDLSTIHSIDDLKPGLRYGIISSNENAPQRKILQNIFRNIKNAHGEYIKIILGTSASSQGINLKYVTQVHVTEEYWNKIREEQVEGRAARIGSHTDLPKSEQKVYIYKYRMLLSTSQQKDIVPKLDNNKEIVSTELYIHNLATTKQLINQQFLKMLKESSFDCNLNYLVNSKLDPDFICLDIPESTGKYIYLPDIAQDPLDNEYQKTIKYETYLPAKRTINKIDYGFKVDTSGKPILTDITINKLFYPQVIVLYDYNLLKNGIENKKKYFIIGTNKLIDV